MSGWLYDKSDHLSRTRWSFDEEWLILLLHPLSILFCSETFLFFNQSPLPSPVNMIAKSYIFTLSLFLPERTKKLLFAGTLLSNQDKNSNLVKSPGALENDTLNSEEETCQPKILRGQCQIDFSGKLIPYRKANWDQSVSH